MRRPSFCRLSLSVTGGLAALLLAAASAAAENRITTLAGTGVASTTGNGGPAISATLNQPGGMVLLPDGSLLVTESAGNVVRMITPAGVISTVAGTGAASNTGDGGAATAATILNPRDIALAPIDSATYYLVSPASSVIRKVNAAGVISTIVGTGVAGYGGDLGPAGSAQLNGPQGIGVAANGDLYIADTLNQRVRVVTAGADGLISATDTITTVTGTGTAAATGDGSPAVLAALNEPTEVLPMADGSVLIADSTNTKIRRIDSSSVMRSWSTSGTATATGLVGDSGPVSTAIINPRGGLSSDGAGGVLVTESVRFRVRQVTASEIVTTVAGSGVTCGISDLCGDGGPGEIALLNAPNGIVAAPGGSPIYIADGNRIRVRIVVPGAGGPTGPTGATGPTGSTGPTGATGATGAAGPAGTNGAQGPAGPDGSAGPAGATGATGPAGVLGRAGLNGAAGPNGLNGTNGTDGTDGGSGVTGAEGSIGPKGLSVSPFGTAGAPPVVVALPASVIVIPAGRRSRMRLYVSRGATMAARAVSDGRAISQQRSFVRAGLKLLDLGRLEKGRYRVVVSATGDAGDTSTDRATLIVR